MTDWHDPLTKKYQTRHADRPSNKYNAVKVVDSKGSFDSKAEREMHGMLGFMERGGLISNIRHHPPAIHLAGKVNWKVDWIVFDIKRNEDIYVEFKGVYTERFKVILQLWPEFGPGLLQVWAKNGNGFYMTKEIKGK